MNELTNEKKIKTYAWLGFLATFLIMIGDYLLEYTVGLEDRELGLGIAQIAWKDMAAWRFITSAWLAAFATPLMLLGCWGLKLVIETVDKKWAKIIWVVCAAGICGGDFIHIFLCLMPIGWKAALIAGEEIATAVVDAQTMAILVPFYVYYLMLCVISVLLIIATFKKKTPFRKLQMLLCPPVFLVVGFVAVQLFGDAAQWLYVGSATRGLMMMFVLTLWAVSKRKKNTI